VPERQDQVLPIRETPSGSDLPNVGERWSISALEDEFRFNRGVVEKIQRLALAYGHCRRIRGDGNCYYRTVVFGAWEAALASGDSHGRTGRLLGVFEEVRYEAGSAEQRAHEQLLQRLRSWTRGAQVEQWIAHDKAIDDALIRACRRLVRLFLMSRAEKQAPNGLTYSDLVRAFDEYGNMEEFCLRVVDPMGRDAEWLAVDALPQQLGVGLRLWILDRRDDVDLVSLDTPGPDGKVDVHALFKPGHYDLLYTRDEALKADDTADDKEAAATASSEGGDGATAPSDEPLSPSQSWG